MPSVTSARRIRRRDPHHGTVTNVAELSPPLATLVQVVPDRPGGRASLDPCPSDGDGSSAGTPCRLVPALPLPAWLV